MTIKDQQNTLLGLIERKRGYEIKLKQLATETSAIQKEINDLNLKINYIIDYNNTFITT